MHRDDFLARVRSSLGDAPSPGKREPYRPSAIHGRRQLADRLARELAEVGGVAHRAASIAGAREQVAGILRQAGAQRVIRGDTPLIRELDLDGSLERADIEVTVGELTEASSRDRLREAAFAADAGVTSADFGVAETGTLALLAAPGQGRTISLLPPVHVAVLHSRDIVFELAALLGKVAERGEPPSALTFITGPSRTGDIEQTLTVGVHGPGELHVVVID